MDASGDRNIRINMQDILGSFNFESQEDTYNDDPFQPDEGEELHGGSYDPDSSFSWYEQSRPFEDVADVIPSDEEDDNIPAGSTCEEGSQGEENFEDIPDDIVCPEQARLTNGTGVQCSSMPYFFEQLLELFKNNNNFSY